MSNVPNLVGEFVEQLRWACPPAGAFPSAREGVLMGETHLPMHSVPANNEVCTALRARVALEVPHIVLNIDCLR